jgi:hypothetical protein
MFRAPARELGLGAFIQFGWVSSQASVAHLPHPVIAYSWDTARNLVAYPVISYVTPSHGRFFKKIFGAVVDTALRILQEPVLKYYICIGG